MKKSNNFLNLTTRLIFSDMLKGLIQLEMFLPLSFLALPQGEEKWKWNKKRFPVVYRIRGRIGF